MPLNNFPMAKGNVTSAKKSPNSRRSRNNSKKTLHALRFLVEQWMILSKPRNCWCHRLLFFCRNCKTVSNTPMRALRHHCFRHLNPASYNLTFLALRTHETFAFKAFKLLGLRNIGFSYPQMSFATRKMPVGFVL